MSLCATGGEQGQGEEEYRWPGDPAKSLEGGQLHPHHLGLDDGDVVDPDRSVDGCLERRADG